MPLRNESYVISKERCPKCKALGNDTAGDNLAVYSDGHTYCYGCGYGNNTKKQISKSITKSIQYDFQIPDDASPDIPFTPMEWLKNECHFTIQNIIDNKILWSNMYNWLIFPIELTGTSICVGFQARNFNKEKPYKWFSKFAKKDLLKVYSPKKYIPKLVLVEDIISSIRVAEHIPSAPIFGCVISDTILMTIKDLKLDNLIIWLDEDKRKEALRFAQRARELGINTRCIYTDIDPKCHTFAQLKEILNDIGTSTTKRAA